MEKNLPECAIMINKLNKEFEELYNEKVSTEKVNEIMIISMANMLLDQNVDSIEPVHNDYDEKEEIEMKKVKQMYDIIQGLKIQDIIKWFKKFYINDKIIQKKILNKLNEITINVIIDILYEHSIETQNPDKDYEVNQMYDIIYALKNHESYDMMYWFKRHNIEDKVFQKTILDKLLEKIKRSSIVDEKFLFSSGENNLDDKMNDFSNKTLYLREFDTPDKKLEFCTRLILPNPYWEGIIESEYDYKEYFEGLICPKSMSSIKTCSCKMCGYINNKISSLKE